MSDDAADVLNRLLALPLEQRFDPVADDVSTGRDTFRKIEPHALAEALGVPSPDSPDGYWSSMSYIEKDCFNLEEYVEWHDLHPLDTLSLIEDKLSPNRFKRLSQNFDLTDQTADHKKLFGLLTRNEVKLLKEAALYRELMDRMENGLGGLARFTVISSSGYELVFEGDIEDDGTCLELRTPYDFRDGHCVNLDNCLVDWELCRSGNDPIATGVSRTRSWKPHDVFGLRSTRGGD